MHPPAADHAFAEMLAALEAAGEATRLAYMTDEAVEGRDAFLEKRDPDWSPFPWYY